MEAFWVPDQIVHLTRRIDKLSGSSWSQHGTRKSDKSPLTIFIHPHILPIRNPQSYIDIFKKYFSRIHLMK